MLDMSNKTLGKFLENDFLTPSPPLLSIVYIELVCNT